MKHRWHYGDLVIQPAMHCTDTASFNPPSRLARQLVNEETVAVGTNKVTRQIVK